MAQLAQCSKCYRKCNPNQLQDEGCTLCALKAPPGHSDPLSDEARKALSADSRILLAEVELNLYALAVRLQERRASINDIRAMRAKLDDVLSYVEKDCR